MKTGQFVIECRKTKDNTVENWFAIYHGEDGTDAAKYLKDLVLGETYLGTELGKYKREYRMLFKVTNE